MMFRRFLLGLSVLLVMAGTIAYLIPLDVYVPRLEQALSAQLHEPVHIQRISIGVLPGPHLELHDLRVGGREHIAAQSVRVTFDVTDLLAGRKPEMYVVIRNGVAAHAPLRKLMDLFGNAPAAAQNAAVREVRFYGMGLVTSDGIWEQIEGRLKFARDGRFESAWFAMDQQKITAELSPLPEQRLAFKVQAHGWELANFPKFTVDALQVEGVLGKHDFVAQSFSLATRGIQASGSGKVDFSQGWRVQGVFSGIHGQLKQVMGLLKKPLDLGGVILLKGTLDSTANSLSALKDNFRFSGEMLVSNATTHIALGVRRPLVMEQIKAHVDVQPGRMELTELNATLYGGKLSGVMSINQQTRLLNARLVASGIAMQPLVEAITNEVFFTGNMDCAAKIALRLDASEPFSKDLLLSGNFHLHDGELTRVDLLQATHKIAKGAAGATRFDALSGLVSINAQGYSFKKLKMVSGALNAEGHVDVSPSLRLDGMLDTDVRGTGGLISMQMVVSGTLDEPVVMPSGSALAGAAVGTMIMGPGIGTAVGIKVGGFLNRLFGTSNDRSTPTSGVPQAGGRRSPTTSR